MMIYGQIAGNQSINRRIYSCFDYIDEADVKRFVKKFHQQPPRGEQIMHTYRELLLGAFLAANQLVVRSDFKIANKTPDWTVFDERFRVKCFIELLNFHIDKDTENDIAAQLSSRRTATYFISNSQRLYDRIWEKCSTYKNLARSHDLAYVVALFGMFEADVEMNEIHDCLFDKDKGLFEMYPDVSGLLYFAESGGRYSFSYINNPKAIRKVDLPSGQF